MKPRTVKETTHEQVRRKLENDPVTLADQMTAWNKWGIDVRPWGRRGKKP